MREDGDLDVKIVSDCKHVQEYASRLTKIGISDITDRHGSKVLDPDVCSSLSFTCLVPSGLLDAAWIETEMLSKSLCKRVRHNEVILDQFDAG